MMSFSRYLIVLKDAPKGITWEEQTIATAIKNVFKKLAITCLDHLWMATFHGKNKHRYL